MCLPHLTLVINPHAQQGITALTATNIQSENVRVLLGKIKNNVL